MKKFKLFLKTLRNQLSFGAASHPRAVGQGCPRGLAEQLHLFPPSLEKPEAQPALSPLLPSPPNLGSLPRSPRNNTSVCGPRTGTWSSNHGHDPAQVWGSRFDPHRENTHKVLAPGGELSSTGSRVHPVPQPVPGPGCTLTEQPPDHSFPCSRPAAPSPHSAPAPAFPPLHHPAATTEKGSLLRQPDEHLKATRPGAARSGQEWLPRPPMRTAARIT